MLLKLWVVTPILRRWSDCPTDWFYSLFAECGGPVVTRVPVLQLVPICPILWLLGLWCLQILSGDNFPSDLNRLVMVVMGMQGAMFFRMIRCI